MSENEMQVYEQRETGIISNEPYDDGLGAMESSDLIIPRMTLVQSKTKNIGKEHAGKFHVNVTGDFLEELRVVAIKFGKSRILFPEDFDPENEPLCRSYDFIKPADNIEKPMCDSCEKIHGSDKYKCAYANWTKNEKGKSKPPRCKETWDYIFLDLNTYMPMICSFKSTALTNMKRYNSGLKMLCKARNLQMWDFYATLGVTMHPTKEDTYVPVTSGIMPLSAEERETMRNIREQLKDVSVKDIKEEMSDDGIDSGGTEEDEKF